MNSYLESIKKQFLYYKMLGEKAMEQLTEEQLFWQYNEESNSIAILVNHIAGNMLSRFTDFLTTIIITVVSSNVAHFFLIKT